MTTRRDFLLSTTSAGVALLGSDQSKGQSPPPSTERRASLTKVKIPRTDLVVSRIAYGTNLASLKWQSADFLDSAVRMLRVAYDTGINFFDLANFYQAGRSEEALGKSLEESPGLRHTMVIQSKCGLVTRDWESFNRDLSQGNIISSTEGSLRRLKTDHLDILLLHYPDPLAQPEEIAAAFDHLHQSGKVRYFGVSNFNVSQLELLTRYVRQPIVANQVRLGLGYCYPLAGTSLRSVGYGPIVDYCQLKQIQVQAYSPLGLKNDVSLLRPPEDSTAEVKQMAEALEQIAKTRGIGPDSIALAWLLRHSAGVVPIIGTTNPEHLAQNCAADGIELTREEWGRLFSLALSIQGLGWE